MSTPKKFAFTLLSLFLFLFGGIMLLGAILEITSMDDDFSWVGFYVLLVPFGIMPIYLGTKILKSTKKPRTTSGPVKQNAVPAPTAPAQSKMESVPMESEPTLSPLDENANLDIEKLITIQFADPFKKGKAALEWHGPETSLQIKDYKIESPLLYTSLGAPKKSEASCINGKLKVGKPTYEPRGSMGYWPSYEQISPAQRANYLTWLAGGRQDELEDIGYAFIFFYGLERRLIVEKQNQVEIVAEVQRLLNIYTESGSFNRYLSEFLVYGMCMQGLKSLSEEEFNRIFENPERYAWNEKYMSAALAWFFENDKILPTEWAMLIAQKDPRSKRSVIAQRIPEEFSILFAKKYQDAFKGGMQLKARKNDTHIQYQAASPTMNHYQYGHEQQITAVRIPAVYYSSQFTKLVKIWDSCVEELRKYSQKISKGLDAETREAFDALPDELKDLKSHPDQEKWESLATENVREDGRLIPEIADIADILALPVRPKLTLSQSKALAESAEGFGYLIEPDARITGKAYERSDFAALFNGTPKATSSAQLYPICALIMELGMIVAAADGVIDESEVESISIFLEDQFMLDTGDIERLHALREVYKVKPPELKGSTSRLKNLLKERQKESVGRLLIGVILADGVVHEDEIKIVKKIYKGMGLSESLIDELLQEITVDAPPVVKGSKKSTGNEKLPEKKEAQPESIQLDQNRIANILRESSNVAQLLGDALNTDEEKSTSGKEPSQKTKGPKSGTNYPGLDARYHEVLKDMLGQEVWESGEITSLMRKHSLMASATISKINEWSEETLGDFLIEEDESITVNKSLLEKTK